MYFARLCSGKTCASMHELHCFIVLPLIPQIYRLRSSLTFSHSPCLLGGTSVESDMHGNSHVSIWHLFLHACLQRGEKVKKHAALFWFTTTTNPQGNTITTPFILHIGQWQDLDGKKCKSKEVVGCHGQSFF